MAFSFSKDRGPLPIRPAQPLPLHSGKTYLVLGAAGGIGTAIAELLIAQGARIFVADLGAERVASLSQRLGCPGAVLDVMDPASVERVVSAAVTALGGLDGLANCVGIAEHYAPLDTTRQEWRRTFEINVFGVYNSARLVAGHMIETGRRGAIVNIASEAGKRGHSETMLAYSASKAAVINMTRMLSEALAAHDVNVNCLCPGSVATPMLHSVAEEFSRMTGQESDDIFASMVSRQLGRHIQPAEVAAAMSFLLSDGAMTIRGQAINVDGGDTPY